MTVPRVPAAFPLVANYELLQANNPGEGVVPSEPVYGREPDQADLSARWGGYAEPPAAFAAWLGTMGAARTRAVTRPHAITVRWRNEAHLCRAVDHERAVMNGEFAGMVQDLLKMRVLTSEEARAAEANVRVQVIDQRGDPKGKLPDVSRPAPRVSARM
jgi:hypothetical protein